MDLGQDGANQIKESSPGVQLSASDVTDFTVS